MLWRFRKWKGTPTSRFLRATRTLSLGIAAATSSPAAPATAAASPIVRLGARGGGGDERRGLRRQTAWPRGSSRLFVCGRLWERSHRPAMNEDLRGLGAETPVCVSFAWLLLGMPERPEPPPPAVTSDPLMLYRQVGWT